MEAAIGFEPMNNGFADRRLTTWLCRLWSGKRDLNPRLQPWQGCTLPLSYSRISCSWNVLKLQDLQLDVNRESCDPEMGESEDKGKERLGDRENALMRNLECGMRSFKGEKIIER